MSISDLPLADEPRPDRCETCRFWVKDEEVDDAEGYCHRGLRMAVHDDPYRGIRPSRCGVFWSWPIHHASDWCGEWQAKAAPRHPILDADIRDLKFSVRSRKTMDRLGIKTVARLCEHTADELLECRNFGMTCLLEVREKLAAHGLKLKGQ